MNKKHKCNRLKTSTDIKFFDSVFKKERFEEAEEFRDLFHELLLSYEDYESGHRMIGAFSNILKVKCGDKYYICNRNHNAFFSSLKQVPYYVRWWGYYGHELYSFVYENITILCVLHGVGNYCHKHQGMLEVVKRTFKQRHPEVEENETICSMELNHAKRSITNRLRSVYNKWNSVYKSMNILTYSNYRQKLFDGFISKYDYYKTKHYRHECMSFDTFVYKAFGVTDTESASKHDRLYFERMYAILINDFYSPLTTEELKKHFEKYFEKL